MSKWTEATAISDKVRREVWERDKGCCIFCGSPYARAEAHYIPRSQGGMGIAKNILTVCSECHRQLDESSKRQTKLAIAREYLESIYPDWNEEDLIYHKR